MHWSAQTSAVHKETLMRLVHSLVTFHVLALGAALSGGCVDNRATLYIESVLAQDPAGEECDLTPPGDLYMGSGRFDPGSGGAYIAHLVIANQMVPLGDNDTLRPETSRIQMEGAEVSIPGQEPFTVPFAVTVQPDASTNPGYITAGVPLMTSDVGPGNYQVKVVVFGKTLGGLNVESGEFVFPITVYRSGTLAYCGTFDEMTEAGYAVDPCGREGQDGYRYACAPGQPQPPGCGNAGCTQ